MTGEERLSELLHRAAPEALGVDFADIQRRVRRRRWSSIAAATCGVAVLATGGVLVAATAVRDGSGRHVESNPASTASPKVRPSSVRFQGIDFALPSGWSIDSDPCGPPRGDHTVVLLEDNTYPADCRYRPTPTPTPTPTTVTLSTVYGPQYALGWPGRRTQWRGQPAWLAEQTAPGMATVTLTLPWLNAVVKARSPSTVAARSLLEQVSVHGGPGLDVPQRASSVFVQSLAGQYGEDLGTRSATITAAADVRRLLADLRTLPLVDSPERACDGGWWPSTALLTVHRTDGTSRTYAARFDGCELVVGGTGAAAVASPQLLIDLKRLVPNSGQ